MELSEALATLGLNEKEAAVYTALLQLGRASAYSIAVKSGLKKPTTYVILDELIRKGLAARIPREKKQQYFARPPEEAFDTAQEKLDLAKQKLPELVAMTKGEKNKVSVAYFEGVAGIQQLLDYRIKDFEDEEIAAFWATDHAAPVELRNYFKQEYPLKTKRHGIKTRAIAPSHPNLEQYRAADVHYDRKIKSVPLKEYSSEVAIDTIGDVVRIQDYKNLQGIVIENKDVAKTVREIFNMLWKRL